MIPTLFEQITAAARYADSIKRIVIEKPAAERAARHVASRAPIVASRSQRSSIKPPPHTAADGQHENTVVIQREHRTGVFGQYGTVSSLILSRLRSGQSVSVQTLISEHGIGESTARAAIARLEDAHVIRPTAQPRPPFKMDWCYELA